MTLFQALSFNHDFLPPTDRGASSILFIFACGYERRSVYLLDRLDQAGRLSRITPLGLTFPDFTNAGSRRENDARLARLGIRPFLVENGSADSVVAIVAKTLKRMTEQCKSVRVIVDYSSMPRRWYCTLLRFFMQQPNLPEVRFWYVQGAFGNIEKYPCVGYGDFRLFAGGPRVTRISEVYMFGLGFDSTRTYGIWNYLDPQFTCCLIGESAYNHDLVNRVNELNHEILLSADIVQKVRIDDFPGLLSSVVDLSRKCSSFGDVCLVADGPKPLVLAMSIAPDVYSQPGIYSWHVAHAKPDGFKPMDLGPTDYVYGFSVCPVPTPAGG